MAPTILIAEFKHETNSFALPLTDLAAYRARYLLQGEAVLPFFRGVKSEMGGFIDTLERHGARIVPAVAANAMPGGKVTRATFDFVAGEILRALRQTQVDGILLALHGAMVLEDAFDGEGELLTAVRELVGPDLPVACTLDLHANMSETMVRKADILIGYDTYPHVDYYERACEAAEMLLRVLRHEIRPLRRLHTVPLLCPFLGSSREPIRSLVEAVHAWEQQPNALSATLFHGFFLSDVPDVAMSILSITDNDPELAESIGEEIAARITANLGLYTINMATAEEAVARALANPEGPVILADTSDNPGGGAPGDSTHILAALIAAKAQNAAVSIIVDPETAHQAAQAGPGARIQVRLGGKISPLSGPPIEAEATVVTLSNGLYRNKGPMLQGLLIDAGLTAVLDLGGIEVVICSNKLQPQDPEIFRRNGIEPLDKKILVIKSAQHFRAAYQEAAKEIIEVNAPGVASQTPANFTFRHVRRPIFPLDA